jgi:transcriptional regulator with XRE-family HTH domain
MANGNIYPRGTPTPSKWQIHLALASPGKGTVPSQPITSATVRWHTGIELGVGVPMAEKFVGTAEEAGQRVRVRRRELGLSQAELGKLAGTSRKFVSDFELGHTRAEFGKAMDLMRAAGMELAVLKTRRTPVKYVVDLNQHVRQVNTHSALREIKTRQNAKKPE